MSNYLASYLEVAQATTADSELRFDAERDTPGLMDALSAGFPVVREIAAGLRTGGLPVMPASHVGSFGDFVRLPNHYRSVCFLVPGLEGGDRIDGVVVFKGTEPLLSDFPQYIEWMLRAPFRASALPLALHLSLDMKLPPGAMWIEESVIEQEITSRIQNEYLTQHGRLARLPVPLFVFELTTKQVERYRDTVRAHLSSAAFSRIEAKVADGLGVEVYFYPTVPVRAADLLLIEVKKAFGAVLTVETLETAFNDWVRLMAELLVLGYMPYAPWNHGMGACVDPGNACIDGGFNDLLTIVPFDSIPGEALFWRSLGQSIQMLATSVGVTCAAAAESSPSSQAEPPATAVAYVTEGLREQLRSHVSERRDLDPRLLRFFERPSVEDVFRHLRETQRERSAAQFRGPERLTPAPVTPALAVESSPRSPAAIGV